MSELTKLRFFLMRVLAGKSAVVMNVKINGAIQKNSVIEYNSKSGFISNVDIVLHEVKI